MAQRRRIRMGRYLLGRHRISRRRAYVYRTVDLTPFVERISFFDPEQDAEMQARLNMLPSGRMTLTFGGFYDVG